MSVNFNTTNLPEQFKKIENQSVVNRGNTLPSGNYKLKTQLTEDKFDYSKDDGKISFKDKMINFGKGLIAPITNMFKSPKNLVIGIASIAGISALTVATGGAIAPLLITAGVLGGAVQLGVSAYKAHTATTDDEAKQAWQGIGTGTSVLVGSVAGAKAAAKGAGIEGAESMNSLEATSACIKNAPKAAGQSFKAFTNGEFLVNLGIKKPVVNQEEVQMEKLSEPKAEPKTEPKAEVKAEPKAEVKAEPKAEVKAEPKAEVKAEPKAEVKAEPKAEVKAEPKAEVKAEPKADTKAEKLLEIDMREKEAIAKFKKKNIEKLPSVEERAEILRKENYPQYYIDEIKDDNNYLEYLWRKTPESNELSFQRMLLDLSPEEMTKFQQLKTFYDSKGIKYDDYTLLLNRNRLPHDSLVTETGTVKGHAGSYGFNIKLRRGWELNPDDKILMNVLDKGFEEVAPTTNQEVVYRGVFGDKTFDFGEFDYNFIKKLISLKKGDVITDKGYSYSSYDPIFTKQFDGTNLIANGNGLGARMKIIVPKGAKVSRAKYSQQKEMLFPRNAQFKVIKPAKDVDGVQEIILKYILPTATNS